MTTSRKAFKNLTGLLLVVAGCVEPGPPDETKSVNLKFAAVVGDAQATCGQVFGELGTTDAHAEFLDLRFYVSDVRLVNAAGQEVPLTLTQDGRWQHDNVALLDFENATGKCADGGTVNVRTEVTGTVPAGDYTGVAFDIGVPFDLNHSDLAAAPAPLNVSALFWSWSIGYKFIRVDLETDDGQLWNMHLGSTGCTTDGPGFPPVSACARPNRPRITLAEFDPDHDTILFDVQALLAASDLHQDTPDSSAGCQSFPNDENECTHLFPNLGIDFESGRCVNDCTSQSVFRVGEVDFVYEDVPAAIARGAATFATPHATAGGSQAACAGCHGADGAGLIGPDIRVSGAAHLQQHAQGDAPHPAGVQFDALSDDDFRDLGFFLASLCEADPACEPGSGDHGDHDHE